MAQPRALSFEALGGFATGTARRSLRNARLTVPVAIALICASFAAVTILQMRLDHRHAMGAARDFEQVRAADLANVAAAGLDRLAEAGKRFAAQPGGDAATDGIRNIVLYDAKGAVTAVSHPDSALVALAALPALRLPLCPTCRSVFANGPEAGIAFRDGPRTIAVLFDPAILAPASLMQRGALLLPDKRHLAEGPGFQNGAGSAAVPGWPLTAATGLDADGALQDWRGSLPLYLFVILGPAVAGAWLAALLVGVFERHAKAAHAIRALRSVRPVEARLMVRLASAERAAMESARAKSEFIAHMSHELRTPLNAVIGFAEVIQGGFYGPSGHPKYGEYAGDIAEAGRQLHAKIGDILEFANIEAGRHPLALERVELAALASACVAEHQGRAFSRRITLQIGFTAPGAVRADASALQRILSNLLANALAYTAEGGAVSLEVRMEEAAGVAILRDSGMGFSAAERGRAGRAFERFDRTGMITGAGLGLAIALELARRMGGAMSLHTARGEGSRMELRLPIAPDSL